MLGASFLPARFRTSETSSTSSKPNWLNRQITPVLQSISRRACTHPIHTIVFVALLASTTYIGLLEGSLFDRTTSVWNGSRPTDLSSLVEGSRRLKIGEETAWKWTIDDNGKVDSVDEVRQRRCCFFEPSKIGKESKSSMIGRRAYSINDFRIPWFFVE